jgi:4'-phosphopantetheinyl transferase EntD
VLRSDLVTTPHGRCAVLELADGQLAAALAALPAAERAHAAALGEVRRREFITGRTAMHELVEGDVAILADDRGAPTLPAGLVGSISHKGARAAAIVAPAGAGHVGIDLELAAAPRQDIGRRILTPSEPRVTGKDLTRVFAIKEAIYKAVDPIVRRYVGFTEVELVGDTARPIDANALPVTLEVWCCETDGYWLATARARRLESSK